MPTEPSIRILAICLFRHGDRILVARGTDDVKGEVFYRPLGGAVEFGERAMDTVSREIREEIGAEIVNVEQLGVLENVFTYRGRPSHEIVFVFDARFVDEDLYAAASVPIDEPVWDGPAVWLDPRAVRREPLYPDGLTALLDGVESR